MTPHVWALLFYALLTIAYTWPVATGLDRLVPHDLGDPLLSTWTLWWNAHVVPFSDRWWEGLAFYPARDTLTFSDHRVGLGWIASPIIWMGGAPLAAHNLAFLLSFFLSATAAYALCYSLTRSAAAALIGGLVFGFNPYRGAHLPHLELLSSYWLPLVLLGVHQWSATLRARWLVLASGALVMQALTSGYYFVFLGVLVGLWLIWFTPRRLPLVQYLRLGAALGVPLLVAAPIFLTYRRAHQALGLSRGLGEIEIYSADLTGLLTTPRLLALWTSPRSFWRPEGELWPGALAVVLIVAGLWIARQVRGATDLPQWGRRLRAIALAVAVVTSGAASIPMLFGPVAYDLAGLRISISDPYKPLSLVAIFGGAWALTSSRARRAFHDQSPFAFYVLATIAMWLFALGPTARVLGQRFLYKAPYAWLMMLPGFTEGFRVPARFAMLAILTLSVAAALAFDRLTGARNRRTRLACAALVAAGIAAESWVHLPIRVPPAPLAMPADLPPDAVILELPVGIVEDFAAMYRSIHHGRRLVNGMSGFDPPHYYVFRAAIDERRYEVIEVMAVYAPIAIFIPHEKASTELLTALRDRTRARPLATTSAHQVWLLPKGATPPADSPATGSAMAVQHLESPIGRDDLPRMLDGNRDSVWLTDQPQAGSEFFIADLGQPRDIEAVVLGQGARPLGFPRALAIDTSADGVEWSEAWRGDTAALATAVAIRHPREIPMTFPVAGHRARYVRVRQIGQSQDDWTVAEFRVLGQ